MEKLSQKQFEILEYMKKAVREKGYPPSVREICDAVGLKSTSTVHGHLERLERKGYIRRDPAKPRAIEIFSDNDSGNSDGSSRELIEVPIVGTVTAGIPILIMVRQQNTADNGDIVVALIEDFATVKTYYKENGYIRLQPENPTMSPIIVRDVSILGKVVGLYRKF